MIQIDRIDEYEISDMRYVLRWSRGPQPYYILDVFDENRVRVGHDGFYTASSHNDHAAAKTWALVTFLGKYLSGVYLE